MQIDRVEKFVLQVNTFMHQEQERARLSQIINRIEDYQAVDVPNDECAKVNPIHGALSKIMTVLSTSFTRVIVR